MRNLSRLSALALALGAGLLLAACGGASEPPAAPGAQGDLSRTDNQGAVTVKVTPLNLATPSATLDFEVVLDTHSGELTMDLKRLALLRTDMGEEVRAVAWPVGSGHHYSGALSFPARTPSGKPLLEGGNTLTLVINDIGGT
ncbi:MAG: hypothetical protein HYY02_13870 [Chloroflexi bacterium]|nr:hypothetical protein [Chloroflexota bacterium]